MFQVNDFNLVFCGIATFAATVGYACSRRLTGSEIPCNIPDSSESTTMSTVNSEKITCETGSSSGLFDEGKERVGCVLQSDPTENIIDSETVDTSRRLSLKRKRVHDEQDDIHPDLGYPHNLASIYPPKKRSRTPSPEDDVEEAPKQENKPPPTDNLIQEDDTVFQQKSDTTTIPSELALTPPATPEPPPRVFERPKTPSPVFGSSATIVSPLPKSLPPSRAVTSSAFAAFAGSASPFTPTTPSRPSFKTEKPAWTVAEKDSPTSSLVNPNGLPGLSADGEADSTSEAITPPTLNRHVLTAAPVSKSTFEHVTGEENEDVELELKGVKLFVKRGDKPYSEGVVGHVKLLSHKTTLDERLLFRREPLWQVSMNVRVRPTIRCTLDTDEGVLRLFLKEAIEQGNIPSQDWKREVVVYALKPGRSCSKQDFKDFASSLMESPGLMAR